MASNSVKHMPINGVSAFSSVAVELKSFFSAVKPRKTSTFLYAFVITFVFFTVFLAFSPCPITISPPISPYILPNLTISNFTEETAIKGDPPIHLEGSEKPTPNKVKPNNKTLQKPNEVIIINNLQLQRSASENDEEDLHAEHHAPAMVRTGLGQDYKIETSNRYDLLGSSDSTTLCQMSAD